MPCVTLHCLVHLLPNIHTISPIPFDTHLPWTPFSMPDFSFFHLPSLSLRPFSLSAFFTPPTASSISGPTFQAIRFPAVHTIATSQAGDANHYTLTQMLLWATIPYAVWQLSYHFLITVRRRDKIAAGRPTSFTWLRKSYANTLLGKTVLHLPVSRISSALTFLLSPPSLPPPPSALPPLHRPKLRFARHPPQPTSNKPFLHPANVPN